MSKFAVGDRVIRTKKGGDNESDVGQIGSVLGGDTIATWVQFDTPTRYESTPQEAERGAAGYCDCVLNGQLAPYHEGAAFGMTGPSASEAVHAPAHYQKGGIETIRFIAAKIGPEGFKSYCLGNVYKYLSRHEDKGGKEDLDKAGVYLGWATNGLPEG